MTSTLAPPHPARYSPAILEHLERELIAESIPLKRSLRVLDPFAGVGTVHELARSEPVEVTRLDDPAPSYIERPVIETVGIELEPEWAAAHPRTLVGDATRLPFPAGSFDAVATSPAYGNRMADGYDGRDGSRRMTYRLSLGRPLSPGSGAALQWGDAYRRLHRLAWHEVYRVLKPGGLFLLNVKDHVRAGREQGVPGWHFGVAVDLGFHLEHVEQIGTPGMRCGANADARVDGELVATFRKPRAEVVVDA